MKDKFDNDIVLAAKKAYEDTVDDTFDIKPFTLSKIMKNEHGDGLLTFVLVEASEADTEAEAAQMFYSAAEQLICTADLLVARAKK